MVFGMNRLLSWKLIFNMYQYLNHQRQKVWNYSILNLKKKWKMKISNMKQLFWIGAGKVCGKQTFLLVNKTILNKILQNISLKAFFRQCCCVYPNLIETIMDWKKSKSLMFIVIEVLNCKSQREINRPKADLCNLESWFSSFYSFLLFSLDFYNILSLPHFVFYLSVYFFS